MLNYRVTKYNPRFRNEKGAYTKREWTEFSDIGKSFAGKVLTKSEYAKVEDAYVMVLLSFLSENKIADLKINRIQNFKNIEYKKRIIRRNQVYELQDIENIFRLVLRGKLWCKFKNHDGSYVDFGWDYYAYIGIPKECKKSIALAKKYGLYVEKCHEPILN